LCNNEYRKQKGCDTEGTSRNSALQRYPFAFLRQSKQKAANHCSAIAPVHLRLYIFKKKLKRGTYKIKVNVTAAGNTRYNAMTKTVVFKVKVKR
jgi:hypothetical protein